MIFPSHVWFQLSERLNLAKNRPCCSFTVVPHESELISILLAERDDFPFLFFFFFFLSQASFSQVYCSNDSRCARCAEGCCSIIYSGTGNQYIQFQGQKKTWRVSACGNLANLDLRCFVIMLLFVHICGVIYFLPLPLSLWTS